MLVRPPLTNVCFIYHQPAAIVMPDTDLSLAVTAVWPVFFGPVGTTGQHCTSTRRLYLHRTIAELSSQSTRMCRGQATWAGARARSSRARTYPWPRLSQ